MSPATHILIVGCGDLGSYLANLLCAENFKVTGLNRSGKAFAHPALSMLAADVAAPQTLFPLSQLTPSVIVYCVAASAQTDEQYRLHYVEGLKNILATQVSNANLQSIFFISSTRVYGQNTDTVLDEKTPAMASDFGGERLLEAEAALAQFKTDSLLKQQIQTTVLRLSGIYGPGRLRMLNLAKNISAWPSQNHWTNRIHRDDAARFIAYLIQRQLDGKKNLSSYIVTDSAPVSQLEVLNWLAIQLGLPFHQPIEPVVGGKRLSNQAMLNTDFRLKYPSYQSGYAALINAN